MVIDYFDLWIKNSSKKIKNEIEKLSFKERQDYFGENLSFGTAGIRAIIGWGNSLLNIYTISNIAYAYGQYLLFTHSKHSLSKKGVLIIHDNRRKRNEFSMTFAKVLSALGIKVWLSRQNKSYPTPLLSYAITKKLFLGGVNITASHNPPQYNGVKIYNSNGVQLDDDACLYITKIMKSTNYFLISKSSTNVSMLDDSLENEYIDDLVKKIKFFPELDLSKQLVTFTSHHGVSAKFVKKISKLLKVKINYVSKQCIEDENFTFSKVPNPQMEESFDVAKLVAEKKNSKIIIASDPDADRFGIMIKHQNSWKILNGNEIAILQLNYKLQILKKKKQIGLNDFVVKSVVTSDFCKLILKEYKIKIYESLTGFRWLIKEALEQEKKTKGKCLLVWEESNGSSIDLMTRDKDFFQSFIQFIEMISYYKQYENLDLIEVMENLYEKYGKYEMFQIIKKYNDEPKKILKIIDKIKTSSVIQKIFPIKRQIDFSNGYKNFAPQNFVKVYFNNSWIAFRPSGTEPIMRIYFDLLNENRKDVIAKIEKILKS